MQLLETFDVLLCMSMSIDSKTHMYRFEKTWEAFTFEIIFIFDQAFGDTAEGCAGKSCHNEIRQ